MTARSRSTRSSDSWSLRELTVLTPRKAEATRGF